MELIDILEVFRDHLVEFSILIFEFIGVGIIIVSGIHGFYLYLKKSPDTKLALAKGLAWAWNLSWEARSCGTVILRSWQEIGIVAGIIVLRAALTFLIHWEIRQEMKEKRGQE